MFNIMSVFSELTSPVFPVSADNGAMTCKIFNGNMGKGVFPFATATKSCESLRAPEQYSQNQIHFPSRL
ncbi:hypothetical protein DDT56_03700 [Brenneria corticis]|uniref:Uncharacterized protein n=1 Tax=Brenneria corticis TaxID=2173106 RepID=A0A2U1UA04_9GAMM|nr:hypothetical protein DDT56_03700 [Brenneria sp. CFCC 11842]